MILELTVKPKSYEILKIIKKNAIKLRLTQKKYLKSQQTLEYQTFDKSTKNYSKCELPHHLTSRPTTISKAFSINQIILSNTPTHTHYVTFIIITLIRPNTGSRTPRFTCAINHVPHIFESSASGAFGPSWPLLMLMNVKIFNLERHPLPSAVLLSPLVIYWSPRQHSVPISPLRSH